MPRDRNNSRHAGALRSLNCIYIILLTFLTVMQIGLLSAAVHLALQVASNDLPASTGISYVCVTVIICIMAMVCQGFTYVTVRVWAKKEWNAEVRLIMVRRVEEMIRQQEEGYLERLREERRRAEMESEEFGRRVGRAFGL
jgi:hypothetical protein